MVGKDHYCDNHILELRMMMINGLLIPKNGGEGGKRKGKGEREESVHCQQ